MRRSFGFSAVFILSIYVLAFPAAVWAADVTIGTDISNAYVWRGLTLNDEGVAQPSIDISHETGLGLNIWGNFDMGDFNNTLESGEFSEVDLTVSYAAPLEKIDPSLEIIDLSLGVIHYLFPQGAATTTELFASLGITLYGPVSVSASGYYDVDEVSDFYANVGGAIDLSALVSDAVSENLSMEAGASIGFAGDKFASAYSGGTDSGAFDWNVGFSMGYAITESVEITGFVNYTDSADSDVLPDQQVDVYGGGGIYYSF